MASSWTISTQAPLPLITHWWAESEWSVTRTGMTWPRQWAPEIRGADTFCTEQSAWDEPRWRRSEGSCSRLGNNWRWPWLGCIWTRIAEVNTGPKLAKQEKLKQEINDIVGCHCQLTEEKHQLYLMMLWSPKGVKNDEQWCYFTSKICFWLSNPLKTVKNCKK